MFEVVGRGRGGSCNWLGAGTMGNGETGGWAVRVSVAKKNESA